MSYKGIQKEVKKENINRQGIHNNNFIIICEGKDLMRYQRKIRLVKGVNSSLPLTKFNHSPHKKDRLQLSNDVPILNKKRKESANPEE